MIHRVVVPGKMRGKQRARILRNGHSYTPQETVNAEAWIKQCAISAGVTSPILGPVRLAVTVYRTVPASWSKSKRAAALGGTLYAVGKPDADNLAKTVGDALNAIAWRDDCQIVELLIVKRYAEQASTVIEIEEITAP